MRRVFFLLTALTLFFNGYSEKKLLPAINAIMLLFQSNGLLQFRYNGKSYTADAEHARGYALRALKKGFLSGANENDMVLDIQVNGMYKLGVVQVNTAENDKCTVTIHHNSFSIKNTGDYFKVTITLIKQEGQMLLLTGSFEAKLHDKTGHEALITEGTFSTFKLL